MIWLVIAIIAFIVLVVQIVRDSWSGIFGKLAEIIVAYLIMSFGWLLVTLIVSGVVSCFAELDYEYVSDTKIIALKDNLSTSGRFYITSGHVDEDLYYYYAVDTELGYKTEKVKADNTYVKYSNVTPHIEEYHPKFVNNWVYIFAFPVCDYQYVIYCPEGTMTTEFNIDLE